jgi:nucleoside-diphosphate-sugar epimerase
MEISKKFNKPRLLVIGCGDVGMRFLPLVCAHYRVFAVTSQRERFAELRAAGAVPLLADLDQAASLRRLAGLAQQIVHLAPPPGEGVLDRRTRNVTAILPDRAQVVYVSTTGVYGDLGGRWADETQSVAPRNTRALRRVDAERVLRAWARRANGRVSILRVPGIYAQDRLPIRRLEQGTPALRTEDDVYTNHIHADDLARVVLAALRKGFCNRVYHAVDDTKLKMGDYFDMVADHFGLPRPPRLDRATLAQAVAPTLLSFMSESRRLANRRLKEELQVRLQYPDVAAALRCIKRP